jgi:hypothetical protein
VKSGKPRTLCAATEGVTVKLTPPTKHKHKALTSAERVIARREKTRGVNERGVNMCFLSSPSHAAIHRTT